MTNLEKTINFNIGDSRFTIKYQTLMKKFKSNMDSLILHEAQNKDVINVERDPKYFGYIINYFVYRANELKLPETNELVYLLNEAKYFRLDGLIKVIMERMHRFSNLLSDDQMIRLTNLIKKETVFHLIYRATRDGFSAKDFHFNCDGIHHTLTIIQTTKDKIFGGYTTEKWSSDEGGKH